MLLDDHQTPEWGLKPARAFSCRVGARSHVGADHVTREALAEVVAGFMPSTQGLEREMQETAAILECTDKQFLPPAILQKTLSEVPGNSPSLAVDASRLASLLSPAERVGAVALAAVALLITVAYRSLACCRGVRMAASSATRTWHRDRPAPSSGGHPRRRDLDKIGAHRSTAQ